MLPATSTFPPLPLAVSLSSVLLKAGGARKIDSIEELKFSQRDYLWGTWPWPSHRQGGTSCWHDSRLVSMLPDEAQAGCQRLCSIICQAEKDLIAKNFKRRTNYVWSWNAKLLVDAPDGLVDLKDGGLAPTFDEVRRIIHSTEIFPIFENLGIIQSFPTYQRMTLLSPALSSSKTGTTSSKLNFFTLMSRMSFWTASNSNVLNL